MKYICKGNIYYKIHKFILMKNVDNPQIYSWKYKQNPQILDFCLINVDWKENLEFTQVVR